MQKKLDKCAFTLCSNNYYSFGITCAKSYSDHHLLDEFFIVVVDRPNPNLKYIETDRIKTLFIEELGIGHLRELINKYNIVELNTSVKASVFKYIFNRGYNKVTYLDPDMLVYSEFEEIVKLHKDNCPIILTPHMLHPRDSSKPYTDQQVLTYGIFNLGFISVLKSEVGFRFLDWWEDRLAKYCYANISKGMFTDQLWINHVPVFFPEALILRHYGYNVAYWNLSERVLRNENGLWYVNDQLLRLFHFSHFKPQKNNKLVYNFEVEINELNEVLIISLCDVYKRKLYENHYADTYGIQCAFSPKKKGRKISIFGLDLNFFFRG